MFGWGNQNLISDWANFLYYISIFLYGFLLVSDSRMLQVVQRNQSTALIAAAILSPVILLDEFGTLSLPEPVFLAFYAIACWCWLVAIIGIGRGLLNFTNRILRYASDAVLPVYILHQTVIVALGFYIIKWNMGVAPKYFFVVATTLFVSLTVYEVVRRINVTRFLFGMKLPIKKSQAIGIAA